MYGSWALGGKNSNNVPDPNEIGTKYLKGDGDFRSKESINNAGYYNSLARGHWGVENHLHWHLDVTFREDDCQTRKGNAPENLSTLRKLALQIIKEQRDGLSLKNVDSKRRMIQSTSKTHNLISCVCPKNYTT